MTWLRIRQTAMGRPQSPHSSKSQTRAHEDRWADPRGEFLSCVGADPVYKLLNTSGLSSHVWPTVEEPVVGRIGYHVHNGKHDVTEYDWAQYLDFADRYMN
jgi:hypothetical protein